MTTFFNKVKPSTEWSPPQTLFGLVTQRTLFPFGGAESALRDETSNSCDLTEREAVWYQIEPP